MGVWNQNVHFRNTVKKTDYKDFKISYIGQLPMGNLLKMFPKVPEKQNMSPECALFTLVHTCVSKMLYKSSGNIAYIYI